MTDGRRRTKNVSAGSSTSIQPIRGGGGGGLRRRRRRGMEEGGRRKDVGEKFPSEASEAERAKVQLHQQQKLMIRSD